MAFRQTNRLEYKQFIKSHLQELLQFGLPLQTLEYEAWSYLLAHGSCIYTGWQPDELNQSQIQRFFQLLIEYNQGDRTLQTLLKEKLQAWVKIIIVIVPSLKQSP